MGGNPGVRSVSLASNVPMITAIGNAISYEQIFRQQLIYYLQPGDAVLLVSSSGNSPNVIEACKYANEQGIPTIAFVGFQGGEVFVPILRVGIGAGGQEDAPGLDGSANVRESASLPSGRVDPNDRARARVWVEGPLGDPRPTAARGMPVAGGGRSVGRGARRERARTVRGVGQLARGGQTVAGALHAWQDKLLDLAGDGARYLAGDDFLERHGRFPAVFSGAFSGRFCRDHSS